MTRQPMTSDNLSTVPGLHPGKQLQALHSHSSHQRMRPKATALTWLINGSTLTLPCKTNIEQPSCTSPKESMTSTIEQSAEAACPLTKIKHAR